VTGVVPKKRVKTEVPNFDLSGQRYHHLFVMRREGTTNDGHGRFLCRCDCGVEKYVSSRALKDGQRSCGCQTRMLIRAAKFDDLTGKKFGSLVVRCLDDSDPKRSRWVCDCDCGNSRVVYRKQLIQGTALDCDSLKNDNVCSLRSA
jgi:hypothetical protein